MASQAGVFFFDGRPTDRERTTLATSLEPLAPDGVSVFASNGIAMAHGAFHVWPGEATSSQPWRSPAGHVVMWDGRLDNRDDLQLRLSGTFAEEVSDTQLAVAAFERWGIDGLRDLIGDWSLVIWDSVRRCLHLARDYMGIRPLYYCTDSRSIMWSTSLGELTMRAGRVDELDDEFAARFMALRLSTDVTPYRGIRSVPTATCVTLSEQGDETRRRFWSLTPGYIRYGDPGQYEDHLRSLWTEAVASRLRTDRTVCAELSGGLDSSSVVCMAAALIKAGRVPAPALQPVSHVTLESPEGDERRFIAEVESRTGLRSQVLGVERCDQLHSDWGWITPFAPQGVQVASVQIAREQDARVLLSGRLGDLVMGCSADNSIAVFDDLGRGAIRLALANMRRWSRASRKPYVEIGCELLRIALRGREPIDRARLSRTQQAGRDLLTDRLRAQLALDWVPAMATGLARLSKRSLAASVLDTSITARLEVPNESAGVLFTYPFAHRPLIDFVLAIPGDELSAPAATRALMRRAFDGLLPPRVLGRLSKGYYPPALSRAVRPLAAALRPVEQMEVVRRGWLDPARVDAAIRVLVDGGGNSSGTVQRVLRLEQWLRSRDRRAPAAMPKGKEVTTNAELFIA